MKLSEAKQLHNGDEVLCKQTGESINVLSISISEILVEIEGIGSQSGFGHWHHRDVC